LPPGDRPSVAAWTPRGDDGGAAEALRSDIVDVAAGSVVDAIDGAELVILAGPATAILGQLTFLAGAVSSGATVTDVASTKGAIIREADGLGLRFVGGHPMAGREASGFTASTADLFQDRPWVVVPGSAADVADIGRVEWLVAACGARSVRMSADEHDAVVAGISHLPLVLSAALVEVVAGTGSRERGADWPRAASLAAGGWASMTRLARGDPAMGAGILTTNAPAVTDRLRALRETIDAWLAELERGGGPDEARLQERLARARDRLGPDDPTG
jgi:prephenate dehydrogenase